MINFGEVSPDFYAFYSLDNSPLAISAANATGLRWYVRWDCKTFAWKTCGWKRGW